jgi:hypothetical protein
MLVSLGTAAFEAWAAEPEDFRAAMENNNAEWLQAYNEQDADQLGRMYAEDALLLAAGGQPIRGAKDIEAYWVADVQGYQDHRWQILDTRGEVIWPIKSPSGRSPSAGAVRNTRETPCASLSTSQTGSG